jgi:[protein-PII] uridylyltransferase
MLSSAPSVLAGRGEEPGLPEPRTEDRAWLAAQLPVADAARPDWPGGFWEQGRLRIRELHADGASGRALVRLQSTLADRLIEGLARAAGLEERSVALCALGGYGRRELAPGSDLDLLLLVDGGVSESAAFAVMLRGLWDLGIKVGHAVRGLDDCMALADADVVSLTALLDARLLLGEPGRFEELARAVAVRLEGQRGEEFLAKKRAELATRRRRFGESVYLLEPNLKEGEGGLRDVQTALWMARVRYRVRGLRQLLASSILPPSSVSTALRARDFLFRVRCGLHFLAGRQEDHLTFDRQEQLASLFGYEDQPGRLGVERFMRHCYLALSSCKRVTDELLERCAEPRTQRRVLERPLDAEFKDWGGRLALVDGDLFSRDPTAVVRAFVAAARWNLPLYSHTRDRIIQALPSLAPLGADARVVQALRDLFALPGTDGGWLVPLHELGVLGALVPEFGRVTALAQRDAYHTYTVDVHLILALRRLYALRRGDRVREDPELTRLCLQIDAWLPLCLGVLLHDAGKGGGGGHSERGAALARQVGERWQMSAAEVALAEFLVREHLLLAHTAQRRDLSDPATIAGFAGRMESSERLDLLYLLTCVDVASVGPGTWTDWKASLFRELYMKARAELVGGAAEPDRAVGDRLRLALAPRSRPKLNEAFLARMPARYLGSVAPEDALKHLRLLERLRKNGTLATLRAVEGDVTQLVIAARDRPGLLAILAGTLAAHRIDILAAEVYSSDQGEALDIFRVQFAGAPLDRARWSAASADLAKVLSGEESPQALLARRVRASPLLARPRPAVATKVRIDPQATGATIVEVTAEDRPGLLFLVASTLHALGLTISLAKVSTEANKAIDAFYVTKQGAKLATEDSLTLERALQEALTPSPK